MRRFLINIVVQAGACMVTCNIIERVLDRTIGPETCQITR